ncbi:DNA topoisomerase III [Pseudaeromonas sp. ZJS20]|uniref:DNA topoisomerase III n=1 Tax=Pseudaeromonas aegiceratis TaxID=3153928 RepID=UPI00390C9F2F
MRLFIAEKPSLGRAIAAALPAPQRKGEGYIQCGEQDVVTWCVGHLLEQAAPESYDARYRRWALADLPIVPQRWQREPRRGSAGQLKVIRHWIKQADQLVHAGDPDREGQLLVDEVIDYLQVPAAKRQAMQRCLISDLNLPAVRRALAGLRANQEFVPLSTAALARSRADWLFGINLTRTYTLLARQAGGEALLSVGRVQTPVLGLVVARDRAIAQFVPHDYFAVSAQLQTAAGETFTAWWQPSAACQPWQDEEGRVLNRALADKVVASVQGQTGRVEQLEQKECRRAPPLPYNLSNLQIEAARQLNLTAKQVLDLCQRLYEQHKLITYPRSDCRYLPKEHHGRAAQVSAAMAQLLPDWQERIQGADLTRRGAAWNDAKVQAHHAIIPTERSLDPAKLSRDELALYRLIARQYLAQFYPDHSYQQTRADIRLAGGLFVAKGRVVRELGWRSLYERQTAEPDEEEAGALPPLQPGQSLHCPAAQRHDKQTQPPKAYTDASLLAAMTGIARHVADSALKAILKETDGLGTEATRAGIIELLFTRGYLQRQGKQIHASETGFALVDALPSALVQPDMTAQWELGLARIEEKSLAYGDFMAPLLSQLAELVVQGQQLSAEASRRLGALHRAPAGKSPRRGRGTGKGAPAKRRSSRPARRQAMA